MNTNFFFQTFRAPPGIPAKIPGYPAKKFGFPGFRRTYRTVWLPPLHAEDPHPRRRYPDQKVWVCAPFSCLEAQQRYFSYRAKLAAIVSQNSFVLVFVEYRTIIARYDAKRAIAQMCLCVTKYQSRPSKWTRRVWVANCC